MKHGDRTKSLRLELLCGSTAVSPDHPGHWKGRAVGEEWHPKHKQLNALLNGVDGISVRVSSHEETEDGLEVEYSDAYIDCAARHLPRIAEALKKVEFEGDILDLPAGASKKDIEAAKETAEKNHWRIQHQ